MVWCGNCGGGIWRCLAGKRARGQRWDLDQPMGCSSSRRMDQPMGLSSSSRAVDQYVGSSSSRWVGQLVVTGTVDKFACPRNPTLR
jgi:hypothetical protein